jgi:hypothetical protein
MVGMRPVIHPNGQVRQAGPRGMVVEHTRTPWNGEDMSGMSRRLWYRVRERVVRRRVSEHLDRCLRYVAMQRAVRPPRRHVVTG